MKIKAITLLFMIGISCIISASFLATQYASRAESYSQSSVSLSLNGDMGTLPSRCISLILNNGLFGTVINATLTFGFNYESDSPWPGIQIGFRQEYLEVVQNLGAVRIQGLGFGERREYPFMYFSDGEFFNHWINVTPSLASRRLYAAWTETDRFATYTGIFHPEKPPYNASQVIFAGDIIEYENLTIYFEDGTSFQCGPRLITVGANFTQTEEGWLTERIIEVSDDYTVVLTNSSISFALSRFVPPDFIEIGLLVSIPVVIIVLYYFNMRLSKETSE